MPTHLALCGGTRELIVNIGDDGPVEMSEHLNLLVVGSKMPTQSALLGLRADRMLHRDEHVGDSDRPRVSMYSSCANGECDLCQ